MKFEYPNWPNMPTSMDAEWRLQTPELDSRTFRKLTSALGKSFSCFRHVLQLFAGSHILGYFGDPFSKIWEIWKRYEKCLESRGTVSLWASYFFCIFHVLQNGGFTISTFHVSKSDSPFSVNGIWGGWGSYDNIRKAIFYLLKGDYVSEL